MHVCVCACIVFAIDACLASGFFGCWCALFISFTLCYTTWMGSDATPDLHSPLACMGVLLLGSLFEMWAAASLCDNSYSCENELAWAVACGAISLFICLCMTVMASCDSTKSTASQMQTFVAVLLFLLWAAGAGICTFKGPFNTACGHSANGYFACWICFVASCVYLFETVPAVEHFAHETIQSRGTSLGGVLVTSLVVVAQAAYDGDNGRFTGMRIWAVTAGSVSAVLASFSPGTAEAALVVGRTENARYEDEEWNSHLFPMEQHS